MSEVRVRYYAYFSQLAGRREEKVEVRQGATLGELLDRLGTLYGAVFRKHLASAVFFLNGAETGKSAPLKDGDELHLMVPVGGG